MRKPTICICETKGTDQLCSNCAFVFHTRIVQFLYFLNPKFPASSYLLFLYISVCVGPVQKPHCWFSHKVAHMCPNFADDLHVQLTYDIITLANIIFRHTIYLHTIYLTVNNLTLVSIPQVFVMGDLR